MRRAAWLLLSAGVLACDGGRDREPTGMPRGPEGGVLTFDAAMIPRGEDASVPSREVE